MHQQVFTWKTGPFGLFYFIIIDKQEFSFWGQKGGMTINKLGFFYKPFVLSHQLENKIWTLVSQCVWYLTIENRWLSKIDDVTISFAFYILFVTMPMDVEWQLLWLILCLWCKSTSIYRSIGSHIFKHRIILHIEHYVCTVSSDVTQIFLRSFVPLLLLMYKISDPPMLYIYICILNTVQPPFQKDGIGPYLSWYMSIPVFPKVFLLLQDIQAGNRKNVTRPNQLLPDQNKLTVKDTYKMLIILCLWYLIS